MKNIQIELLNTLYFEIGNPMAYLMSEYIKESLCYELLDAIAADLNAYTDDIPELTKLRTLYHRKRIIGK